jgi:hypothetical protein
MLIGLPSAGAASPVDGSGFTANTLIDLTLEETVIDRTLWCVSHNFQAIIDGTIRISNGSGVLQGQTNKIMLYGDRTEPRLPGESDWSTTSYPANVFIYPDTVSTTYTFQFGPACEPDGYTTWYQDYLYRAVINRTDGTSANDPALLSVWDCAD